MTSSQTQASRLSLALGLHALGLLLLIASALTACETSTVSPGVVPSGAAISDPLTPAAPTAVAALPPALATDIAKNTQIVTYGYHIATSVALTHAPTRTVGVPVYPTPSLELGISGGCSNTNSLGFQCYNAWRGYRDNRLMDVLVGREGRDGDPTQGEIMILSAHQIMTYLAPGKSGALDIVAVDGDLLTVTAIDSPNHETFVFNLRSRQWTPTTPAPMGTPAVTP